MPEDVKRKIRDAHTHAVVAAAGAAHVEAALELIINEPAGITAARATELCNRLRLLSQICADTKAQIQKSADLIESAERRLHTFPLLTSLAANNRAKLKA